MCSIVNHLCSLESMDVEPKLRGDNPMVVQNHSRTQTLPLRSQIDSRGLRQTVFNQYQSLVPPKPDQTQSKPEPHRTPCLTPQETHSVENHKPGAALCHMRRNPPRASRARLLESRSDNDPAESSSNQPRSTGFSRGRTISFRVVEQPTSEIPTRTKLPPVVVELKGTGVQSDPHDMLLGYSSLWGIISLVSADTKAHMAQFHGEILTAESTTSPLISVTGPNGDLYWYLKFQNLQIHQPGYFKLQINLIGTSHGGRHQETPAVGTPSLLMSTHTRLLHAHAFAPRIQWTS